jgi:hypothetical protein
MHNILHGCILFLVMENRTPAQESMLLCRGKRYHRHYDDVSSFVTFQELSFKHWPPERLISSPGKHASSVDVDIKACNLKIVILQ